MNEWEPWEIKKFIQAVDTLVDIMGHGEDQLNREDDMTLGELVHLSIQMKRSQLRVAQKKVARYREGLKNSHLEADESAILGG